jgi:DNA modification methylase
VLDPFGGSGTTAIATFNVGEGRSCDTYDISEPALDIASLALNELGVSLV